MVFGLFFLALVGVRAQCDLEVVVISSVCDFNGTFTDPTDDVFYSFIQISGSGFNGWTTNDIGFSEGGSGDGLYEFGPYPINDGDHLIILTDLTVADCTAELLIPVPVCDPSTCLLTADILSIDIIDNGTSSCSDATYTFTVNVSAEGANVTSGWRIVLGNGQFLPGGNYNEPQILGPFPLLNSDGTLNTQNIRIADDMFITCTTTFTIAPPAPEGCDCEPFLTFSVGSVDNNQTPNTCNDDFVALSGNGNIISPGGTDYQLLIDGVIVANQPIGGDFDFIAPADGNAHILTLRDAVNPTCARSYPLNILDGCIVNQEPVNFYFEAYNACTGENICVPLRVADFNDVLGMQFSGNYNPTELRYTGAVNFNPVSQGFSTGSIGNPSPGNLTFTWNDPFGAGITLPDQSALVELCFTQLADNNSASYLGLSGMPTPVEIVNGAEYSVPFIFTPGQISCNCPITTTETLLPFLNNGTPTQCSDDSFSLVLTVANPEASGETWQAINELGTVLFAGTYGVPTEIGPFPAFQPSLEISTLTFQLQDVDNPACTRVFIYTPPAPTGCDCEISATILPPNCGPNGFIVIANVVSIASVSNGWLSTSEGIPEGEMGGNYGQFEFGLYSFGNTYEIIITDATDATCTTSFTLNEDIACPNPCGLSANWQYLPNDNGTPYNFSDDYFEILVNPSGTDLGTTWRARDGLGGVYTGTYGTPSILGPYHITAGDCNATIILANVGDTQCYDIIQLSDVLGACNYLQGTVRRTEDCSAPGTPLVNWLIEIRNDNYLEYRLSDAAGNYGLYVPTGSYQVTAIPVSEAWTLCEPAGYTVSFTGSGETQVQDLLALPLDNCPLLEVNLNIGTLRRCFDNGLLTINYENVGTDTLYDGYVAIILPSVLSYASATMPLLGTTEDTLWFQPLLPLAPGEEGSFRVYVEVSCAAQLGSSLCITALGLPYGPCPQADLDWSGASLQVSGACTPEEVVFTLRNVGDAPMPPGGSYIIVQDVVMLMQAPEDLPPLLPGEATTVSVLANGATYRLEATQAQGHPGPSFPSAVVEGCGTNTQGETSMGFATQFPLDDEAVFVDEDCTIIRGSYDPNDKQAEPLGYADAHYIAPDRKLEYRIRFQNTGNDTAFTVVIRDTLSPWLDMRTFSAGVSSNTYRMELDSARALSFVFDHILLPDSTTNLEASQGFVEYSVRPMTNAPLETRIENTAAIYFDYNEPIITNTVFHTLGRNFVDIINWTAASAAGMHWRFFPNPSTGLLQLEWEDTQASALLFIYDARGQLLQQQLINGSQATLHIDALPPGLYMLQLLTPARVPLASGKLIKR